MLNEAVVQTIHMKPGRKLAQLPTALSVLFLAPIVVFHTNATMPFNKFRERFVESVQPFIFQEWYEPLVESVRRACNAVVTHQDTILDLANRLDEVKTMSGKEANEFIRERLTAKAELSKVA
jgi:hypothetical protein